MSNDSISVTSSKSWFSRLGSAIAGVLFGIVLFLGSFVLLSWNEGRAIHREKTLAIGSKSVVSVPASPVSASNDGKLVHVTGQAEPEGNATDPVFDLSLPAVKLRRSVEMYQWSEKSESKTQQKLGGGEETVTTYTYEKKWSPSAIDSSAFQKPEGHTNPDSMPVSTEIFSPDAVYLGDFTLTPDLLGQLSNFESYPITANTAIHTDFEDETVTRTRGGLYVGADPATPAIGDLRISFEVIPAGPVTVVARQVQQTFEPYNVKDLGSIEILRAGTLSAENVFTLEAQANSTLTWILRLAGFLMMLIGLQLIVNPLSVFASVIPFLGSLVNFGFGFLTLVVALPLTIGTIAIAWLAYRPLIGIPLLLVAGACIFFAARLLPRKKKATA